MLVHGKPSRQKQPDCSLCIMQSEGSFCSPWLRLCPSPSMQGTKAPQLKGAGSKALKGPVATCGSPPAVFPGPPSYPAHQNSMQCDDPTFFSRSYDICKGLDVGWSSIKLCCLKHTPCCLQEMGGFVAALLGEVKAAERWPACTAGRQPSFLCPLQCSQ